VAVEFRRGEPKGRRLFEPDPHCHLADTDCHMVRFLSIQTMA